MLQARCDDVGATMLREFRDWEVEDRLLAVGGQSFLLRGVHATYEDVYLPMFGEYAVRNAAAAIVALEAFVDGPLDDTSMRAALDGVRWPGRMEIVSRKPTILSGRRAQPCGRRGIGRRAAGVLQLGSPPPRLVSISADKDVAGMVRPLAALADVAHVARNESERSADPPGVRRGGAAGEVVTCSPASVAEAIEAAQADAPRRPSW